MNIRMVLTQQKMIIKSLTESLSSNTNSMSWWSTVKWLHGKGRDPSLPTIGADNKDITDNEETTKTFNEFFLSRSNIDDSNAELPDYGGEFLSNVTFIEATEQKLYDLLKCIATSQATGLHGISPKLLHEAGAAIVTLLTQLLNLYLSKCKMPKQWKLANVMPLCKKGKRNHPITC